MEEIAESREQLLEELAELRKHLKKSEETEKKIKKLNRKLREKEGLFRSLVDTMLDAHIIVSWEGSILFANNAAVRLIGMDLPDKALKLNVLGLVEPEFRTLVLDHLQMVKNGKGGFLAEYKIRTLAGEEKWVEALGTKIRFQGKLADQVIIRDITERKTSNQALRESEERYRSLFEHASDAIFVLKDDRFVDCNTKTLEIFGCSREQIIDSPPSEFSPELQHGGRNSRQKSLEKINQAYDGIPQFFEWTHSRTDGTEFETEVSLKRIELSGVPHLLAIVRDITQRKKTEEALRESEEKYRLFVERASDGITIVQDRIIKYINPRLAEMLGRTTDEVVGTSFEKYVDPAELAGVEDRYRLRMQEMPVPTIYETILQDRDGNRIYVEFNAGIINYEGKPADLVIVRDITERKQVEEALRGSEEKMRAIFESSVDGIYVTNLEYNLLEVNNACIQIFGYSNKKEVLGQNVLNFLKKDEYENARRMIKNVLAKGYIKSIEFVSVKKDGSEFPIELSTALLKDESGNPVGFVGNIKDSSERKQLEEQLSQSQKIEAIGRLAGGVAHDFNNILTVIRGYCELMYTKLDDASPLYKSISQIDKASKRAEGLTKQLLAFSRRQVMQSKVLNLNSLILDDKDMFQRLIGEDIELEIDLDENLGNIKADPSQIQQVLLNLVVNARDAMPDGGRLTFTTRNITLDDSIKKVHKPMKGGNYVLLTVRDTGTGMNKDIQKQIFEPFFTTKPKGKGTGLGLSTVYGIVKQSGGFIWVYSAAGEGAIFKIYLPRVKEKVPAAKVTIPISDRNNGKERILVAEDEDVVRELVCNTLGNQGYQILEAANGQEALDLCLSDEEHIDMVLTDVIMPVMNGSKLVENLKTKFPDIKVLFMSGYTGETIVAKGVWETSVQFLQKPFSQAGLIQKVREVLKQDTHIENS